MKYKITTLILIAALAVALSVPVAAVSKVSFPGTSKAPDPTGRYTITWADSSPHELFFKAIKKGNQQHFLSFTRHVDVFWSPDGNAFAVTDWGGSDYSDAVIYLPEEINKPINLKDALKKTFGGLPEIERNHHVYFEVLDWATPEILTFKVHGYGDFNPDGFEKVFDFNLKDGKINRKQ